MDSIDKIILKMLSQNATASAISGERHRENFPRYLKTPSPCAIIPSKGLVKGSDLLFEKRFHHENCNHHRRFPLLL